MSIEPLPRCELEFQDVEDVQESWKQLKSELGDYKDKLGETLLKQIIALVLSNDDKYSAPIDIDDNASCNSAVNCDDDDVSKASAATSKSSSFDAFLDIKTSIFLRMLNAVIDLLGPNVEKVTKALKDLGRKHRQYNVATQDFALIGDALILTLQKHMGDKWNTDLEASWRSIYEFISVNMVAGLNDTAPAVPSGGSACSTRKSSKPSSRKKAEKAPFPTEIRINDSELGFFSRHFKALRRRSA